MTMDDVQRSDCNLPLIDLTNDNASSNNHIVSYISIPGSDERSANHSPEIIDLTEESNLYFTSSAPVIDLTSDNDQFLNHRIPVIDLTDDDVQDITHQTQYIDLTCNDASISNSTFRNFNLGGTDDKEIYCSTKRIDLTHGDIQNINPNKPITDLTCNNDQFLSCRIEDIDMTDDGVRDITLGLQSFDIIDGKQQNADDCIPTNDFMNHSYQSIGRINPVPDLTNDEDCDNDRGPNINLMRNDYRRPIDDVEMFDLSYNNSPNSFHKPVIESNLPTPSTNFNYNRTENDYSKINEMHIGSLSNMLKFHRRKEILEKHPIENSFENRKETILTNNLSRKKPVENYSIPETSEKISQNYTSDFLKPAHQPVPLRHSFGRSTVNTSPNVLIEGAEASEGQTLTVSSLIQRKKSKSAASFSKHNRTKSKNLAASDKKEFPFKSIEGFVQKFWISFILLWNYITGFYNWMLKVMTNEKN